MPEVFYVCSDILTLDIGGKETVKICRSTLTIAAGSKLADMFSGRWDESLPNEKGHLFFDHKPEQFLPLLDFARSSRHGSVGRWDSTTASHDAVV